MAGVRSCQRRGTPTAGSMSFQRSNRSIQPAMSEALQNDFSYNPRPPPPSAEEIDFFCVDMRRVLMEIDDRPNSSKYPDFIHPVNDSPPCTPVRKRNCPGRKAPKKTPVPQQAKRDGYSR
uniref:Uncharacterized protein ORF118 n=1 Tax=Pseudocowpox virus TaxID=129726 RepID=G3G9Z0_9POXV|nr:hypothetical protein [Pseudocowpox virus]